MSKIQKASVTTVKIGHLEVQGLLLADGNFGIAIPQIVALSLVQPNLSLKRLKASLGIDFPSGSKAKTPLNSKAVNVISLPDFERLLCAADRKLKNQAAMDLRDQLAGLSLHQLFSDSFKIKFEKEERQAWLEVRQDAADLYKSLMEEIKQWYLVNEGREPSCWSYVHAARAMNKALLGMQASEIRKIEGVNRTRDAFGRKTLRDISILESLACSRIKRNSEQKPLESVKEAIDLLEPVVANYKL